MRYADRVHFQALFFMEMDFSCIVGSGIGLSRGSAFRLLTLSLTKHAELVCTDVQTLATNRSFSKFDNLPNAMQADVDSQVAGLFNMTYIFSD